MYKFFETLLNPFPNHGSGTPPKSLFAFCRYYARGTEPYLILVAILTGLSAALEVFLYGFIGQLVDWLAHQNPETLFQDKGHILALMAILVMFIVPFTIFLHTTLVHQTFLGNFPMAIRWQVHRYLLGQSMAYYQDEFAGRLATKLMQTALAVRETILKLVDVLLFVAIYFLSALVLVFNLDWRLSLPFIAWLGIYLALLRYFLPKLRNISSLQADARSTMTGRIVDTYTNISTVKLFSHAARESDYAREGMEEFLHTVYPQMRLATSFTTSVWISNALLLASVAGLSLWLWSSLLISAGTIAAACALALRLNGMSHWIMWEVSSLFENIGTVRDGMNTLTLPRSVQDKPNARPLDLSKGAIEYQNVSFHYDRQEGVIENFNLNIQPGEKIGLVGRSGAGKSTLVNLLLRFYDLAQGSILIDGQNITEVTQESLRQHMGVVTQDTSLLHRSVRDNLRYGNPNATDADIVAAAKQASAHEFILALQDNAGRTGYDAHVGERGVKLSGGQRQRIAIARVLLKNAPILLLDEATSALDSEVEVAIQQNLVSLMQGKTVIAIAHRLSTIAALDKLIVLDEGKIVEHGTHEQLKNAGGIYAKLWQHQSGGFLGDL
jgi:ATP-binding cassette subfamily B multidrug efflux pump